MTLAECINAYVAFKRSLGMRFRSEAELLSAFSRTLGPIELTAVTPDAVRAFIAGSGPVTAFWRQKWIILRGFYRFTLSRGFAAVPPVPVTRPQLPPSLTPYIYSSEELTRLLAATETLQGPRSPLRALTFRTLLLLLYGTGMRIGEALSLTLPDVDVGQRLVTIRDAKFFKSRLVPTGPQLTHALAVYVTRRRQLPLPAGGASAFFAMRTGQALCYDVVNLLFRHMRRHAGIARQRPDLAQAVNHEVHLPGQDGGTVDLSERTIRLGKYALGRHAAGKRASPFALQHPRPNAEPAVQLYGPIKIARAARKPVQDEGAGTWRCRHAIEHGAAGAPAMHGHDAASSLGAFRQNVLEDRNLRVPMRTELRRAVESDLADIANLRQDLVKETQFDAAIMGKLRMQAQGGPDARRTTGERARPFPRGRRGSNGEDIQAAASAVIDDGGRIGIEVEVAVKIDHRTPAASRRLPSS